MEKVDNREKVTIVSRKDLELSYFVGPGKGGQAKQKCSSGCQIKHIESGAIGRCSESRSQDQNKQAAFKKLLEDPKMKFWIAKKIYEIQQLETIEETVEKECRPQNLKFEVKDENGRWIEVSESHFNSLAAKEEIV